MKSGLVLKKLLPPFPSSLFSSASLSPPPSSLLLSLRHGEILRRSRVFSSSEVAEYSKLTGDANPLHFDLQIAKDLGFDRCVVHGLLVASLFPNIIASHFPGAVYVSQTLHFKSPVYVGEEVAAEVQAFDLKESKKRCLAKFSTKCFKGGDILVIEGEAVALLPSFLVKSKESQS